MTVSATLAINEETAKRRAAGLPVVPLGFGEAGLPVHESLVHTLGEAAGQASYGPVAGIADLRDAAAGYWERRGIPTSSERVIAGPGSKALLYALLHASGGGVALPGPSWVSYAAQAALLRIRAELLPTLRGEGGAPDPHALDAAATRCRRDGIPLTAVVLTLPDNPTGTVATPETVRATCAVAERHDLLIISDEIYRDLVHDQSTAYLSPAEVAPERTVVTTGLSKSLALGGWRTGVARFPDGPRGTRLLEEVAAIASEIWSAPAHPVQCAAAWAFTEPECLRERIQLSRQLHGRVARAVADQLRALGASVPSPTAGFYVYPDLEAHRDTLRSRHGIRTGPELATALLDGPGIATLPAAAFGEPPAALRLRMATSLLYGTTHEEREQSLRSEDPTSLPWVADHLTTLRTGMESLLDRGRR
ncbi:MAG: pyridoxal phosphate-dependent aminotransferase [Ornithinibacter sp.]